jgi:DNA-binding transcriptional MocR family regulator
MSERGLVEGRGRAGTVVAFASPLPGEGARLPIPAVDLAGGNPDPALLPDLRAALLAADYEPPLYGVPPLLPALRDQGRQLFSADADEPLAFVGDPRRRRYTMSMVIRQAAPVRGSS